MITLPGGGDAPPHRRPAANHFSSAFVKAAVDAAAELREWRAALRNAITGSYATSASYSKSGIIGFTSFKKRAVSTTVIGASANSI